jgi:hypothetical protein
MKLPEIQDVNNRIYSELFAGSSNTQVGARMLPKVEGFNCTWINSDRIMGAYVDAQFTFASSEERKVMKIIDKHGGKIIDTRTDLKQNYFTEINLSGKETEVERVNEVIGGLKWR